MMITVNQKQAMIEEFERLILVSPQKIITESGQNRMIVEGSGLHIRVFSAEEIVISGIHLGDDLGNFVFSGAKTTMVCAHRVGGYRSGTGDVFGAILAADLVNGVPLEQSVRKAAAFITKTIFYTQQLGVPETDGICFEEYLWELGRDTREVAI